jgi:ferritin-like metal-binding protein YciE
MTINSPRSKFMHELSDIYDAEHQFLAAQRNLHETAADTKLRKLIEDHTKETEGQIQNLERIFELMGESPKRQPCSGAHGLVVEAVKTLAETKSQALKDTVVGAAATKAEHYEMVAYKDLIASAEMMGKTKVARLLERNREQEVRTARRLERAAPRLLKLAAA